MTKRVDVGVLHVRPFPLVGLVAGLFATWHGKIKEYMRPAFAR